MVSFRRKFAALILAAGEFAAGFLALAGCVHAADLRFSGSVLGSVVDDHGIPQMAADVRLFDRLGRLAYRAVSSADGKFAFPNLPAESYSIRVSSLDYLPARLDRVVVRPGLNSILEIHLTTLLSSIQLTYSVPTGGMSKDWRWVLRSSPATRPINRFNPDEVSVSQASDQPVRIFSGTHAMLSLSGGDTNVLNSDNLSDLGTGFALSTNILQKNQLQLGGSLAQSSGLLPAAMGLCAIYSRKDGSFTGSITPEITFTMSQLGLFAGSGFSPGAPVPESGIPPVRTMSLSLYQVLNVGGFTKVEYGVTGESVDYLEHTMRVSPFIRTTTPVGKFGEIVASYSDGGRPDELRAHQQDADIEEGQTSDDDQLAQSVNTLSRLPQLSYRGGRIQMERTETYEIGYRKTAGARTYALSGFVEDVSNGRVDVAGNTSLLNAGDLMSDGSSATSLYNIGGFKRTGIMASVNQRVSHLMDLSFAYGRLGGLTTPDNNAVWSHTGTLDGFLEERSHNAANAALNLKAPKTFTRLTANYGWTDDNAIIPQHAFTTQNTSVSPGLNLFLRQPLPSLFGMPGHLELSADLRNLLAQGYLPVNNGPGRSLLFVQSPRAIRGGLNFIF